MLGETPKSRSSRTPGRDSRANILPAVVEAVDPDSTDIDPLKYL
jgi:hypothetical protein